MSIHSLSDQTKAYRDAMKSGHELRREKRYGQAAKAYRKAAQFVHADRDALFYMATSLKEGVNVESARAAYQYLLIEHPSFATGWSLYGVFLKSLGLFDEAVSALQRSLRIEDDVATRNSLVVSLYQAGRHDEAIAEGQRNLELKDAMSLAAFALRNPRPQLQNIGRPKPFDPSNRQRNIISFSLWGDNPIYTRGAIVNAQIAPHIYYGWTTRFYCDETVPTDAITELQKAGAQIRFIRDPEMRSFRAMWRFLVSEDPDVDRFICRDADSRLNCQELIAVEGWLRSQYCFHIMRDHIYHMELILAGMWGGVPLKIPNLEDELKKIIKLNINRFADQEFLAEYVWPLISENCITHDSNYQIRKSLPFDNAYKLHGSSHVGGAIKLIKELHKPKVEKRNSGEGH